MSDMEVEQAQAKTKEGKKMDWSPVALNVFLIGIPLMWALSSCVDVYKERIRHSEASALMSILAKQTKANVETLSRSILMLAAQKHLVIFKGDDDRWIVRAVDLADRELLLKLVQDQEQKAIVEEAGEAEGDSGVAR